MDQQGEDLPAGLPSARSNKVVLAVATGVLSLPFLAIIGYAVNQCASTTFADTLGTIPVSGLDKPAQARFELKPGTPLLFALDTGYSFSGNPVVYLEVSLQKDTAVVATKECNMKGFTGIGASGSGSNVWYGDAGWTCTLDVPETGADAIQARVFKAGTGALELTHTSVIVKRP